MSNPFMVSDGTGYKPMYSREELAEAIPPPRPDNTRLCCGFPNRGIQFQF